MLAINNEPIKKSYWGKSLNMTKEVIPAILPKMNPARGLDTEVLGSISMINMKNQPKRPKGLMPCIENNPVKKTRNPRI